MSEWISVKDRLPESGKHVLCHYINSLGKYRIVKGFYAEKYSVPDDWYRELCDYEEEKDEYFIREGWYELADHVADWGYVNTENPVTHWMPLPEPPKEDE